MKLRRAYGSQDYDNPQAGPCITTHPAASPAARASRPGARPRAERHVASCPSRAVDGLGRLVQRGSLLDRHEALHAQVLPRLLDSQGPSLDVAVGLLAGRAGLLAHHLPGLALDEVRLLQARVSLL